MPPPILGHSCRVVTGTACGRLRSVPLSFPKPFHQVPDGLPGTRACSLMPVSRLFGGLFFTMDRTAAGTQRLPGCRLLSLLVAARVATDTACPASGLFPNGYFCVTRIGRQDPSSASLPFFFLRPLRSPARSSVPCACRASAALAAALSQPASPAPFPVWGDDRPCAQRRGRPIPT